MPRITDLMEPGAVEAFTEAEAFADLPDPRPRWRVERPAPADLERVLNALDDEGYRVHEARIVPVVSTAGTSVLVVAERGAR